MSMLYCEQCKVQVTGSAQRCPLCQGPLTGQPEEDAYPAPARRPHGLAVRWAALVTVAAGAACGAVNLSVPESGWWCLFVLAGLATTWLLLWVAVRKRSSPAKVILWQLATVAALALAWDLCTGFYGWSVNYVIPIFIPCMELAMAVTAGALRMRAEEYLFYLALCLCMGLLPLIPVLAGALGVVYPSVICAGLSVVGLAALVLFKGGALKEEVRRRTHL